MRAFIAAVIFAISLFAACPDDFTLCREKFIDNATVENGVLSLPVSSDRNLVYSALHLETKSTKKDPLLGLYLVESPKPNPYIYAISSKNPAAIAAIESHLVLQGKISRTQSGVNSLALFDQPLVAPGVLSGPCCDLEGIITPRGIIEKAYIRHFLQTKETAYGDAGIRVVQSADGVAVASSDPFMPDNPFKAGDIIEQCNGKSVSSAAAVMQTILFAAPGETYDFTLRRNGKTHLVKVILGRRYGGGLISDTYLERSGFYFDADLTLTMASGSAAYAGLLRGDRLIQINGKPVSSWENIRDNVRGEDEKVSLLFERDGFQFFIHLPYKK